MSEQNTLEHEIVVFSGRRGQGMTMLLARQLRLALEREKQISRDKEDDWTSNSDH